MINSSKIFLECSDKYYTLKSFFYFNVRYFVATKGKRLNKHFFIKDIS